jgi:NAD(P)H-dependent FMN reductase
MTLKILGVSGSLRAASTNTRLLQAAATFMPPHVDLHVTSLVGRLPLFNPDVDPGSDAAVDEWVREMQTADGLIISTPEYARGYPGALKNALDWLVSTDAFVNKPFMLLNASTRSTVGAQTLTTVLETMSGVHIASASTMLPLLGMNKDVADIVGDPDLAARIRDAVLTFVREVDALLVAAAIPTSPARR